MHGFRPFIYRLIVSPFPFLPLAAEPNTSIMAARLVDRILALEKSELSEHRRGRHDIYISTLETAKNGGATKTKIISKANLSTAQADKYLEELEKQESVTGVRIPKKESFIWKTTDAGTLVIKACKICHSLADTFT